jgi:hypothetical protein
MAHRHHDLERELVDLREQVRTLRQLVNAMSVLQQAARIVLGLPFHELIEDQDVPRSDPGPAQQS